MTAKEIEQIAILKKNNEIMRLEPKYIRIELALMLWFTRREPGVSLVDIADIICSEFEPEELKTIIKQLKTYVKPKVETTKTSG